MYKEGITKQEDEKKNKNICENKEDKELEVEVEKDNRSHTNNDCEYKCADKFKCKCECEGESEGQSEGESEDFIEIGIFNEYKGFRGLIGYSVEDSQHYGYLLDIPDVIVYGGSDFEELQLNYKRAVEAYIALKKLG